MGSQEQESKLELPHQVEHAAQVVLDFLRRKLALSEDAFHEDDGDFLDLVAFVGGAQDDLHLEGISLADDLGDDLVKHFLLVESGQKHTT